MRASRHSTVARVAQPATRVDTTCWQLFCTDINTAHFYFLVQKLCQVTWLLTGWKKIFSTGWVKKTGLFFRLDDYLNLCVTVSPRKACSMSKFSQFYREKVQNLHFNEFKYSLPNLLQSSQQLKLCYIWPEHINFTQFTLTYSETTVIFPQELVQTKLRVGTLCLDDQHQSFWQLIDRSIQCVLASLSPTVDKHTFQLVNVWNFATIHHLLQCPQTAESTALRSGLFGGQFSGSKKSGTFERR